MTAGAGAIAAPLVPVALLCNFETGIQDDSINARGVGTTSPGTTPARSGAAGQFKFGTQALNQGAAYFPMADAQCNLADGGDFTFDWWQSNILLAGYAWWFGKNFAGGGVGDNSEFVLQVSHNSAGNKLLISPFFVGGGVGFLGGWPASGWNVENLWTHFALVRKGNSLYTFKGGVLGGPDTSGGTGIYDLTGKVFNNPTNKVLNVGGYVPSQLAQYSNGAKEIDGFRFVRKALWTANFTPPTAPPGQYA